MSTQKKSARLGRKQHIFSNVSTEMLQEELNRRGFQVQLPLFLDEINKPIDPLKAEIDLFREGQRFFAGVKPHIRRDFPYAELKAQHAWEYAFIAGWLLGRKYEGSVTPSNAFTSWSYGFEHRLLVMSDKFFKLGYAIGNSHKTKKR